MLDERVLRIPTERLRELHAVHGLAKAGHFTVDDLISSFQCLCRLLGGLQSVEDVLQRLALASCCMIR